MHPLIRLMLAHAGGRDVVPHRPVAPGHLVDREWKHVCECGNLWRSRGDAVWHEESGTWRGPRRQCVVCHRWVGSHETAAADAGV